MAKTNEDKQQERKVKRYDPITVEWLEGSKYHKAGEKSIVHKEQAKKLEEAKKAKIVKDLSL